MQPTPAPVSPESSAAPDRAPFRLLLAGLVTLPFALLGCRDPKVISYVVPKESPAALPASAPVHSPAAVPAESPAASAPVVAAPMSAADLQQTHSGLQTAAGLALTWTAPAAWQSKPASMMRKATFSITNAAGSAELAVTAFPGDVGGEIANVIRWRGQVGLPAISDADALAAIQRLEANGLKIGVVDVAAPPSADAVRLLGAFIPYDGAVWFFKLLGPDAAVAAEKPAFLEFLKSVKPAAATTP